MAADKPYSPPNATGMPRKGPAQGAATFSLRRVVYSYFLTAYGLVLAAFTYQPCVNGHTMQTGLVIEAVFVFVLAPVFVVVGSLLAFASWLGGHMTTLGFSSFIAVIVVPWASVCWFLRMHFPFGHTTARELE